MVFVNLFISFLMFLHPTEEVKVIPIPTWLDPFYVDLLSGPSLSIYCK
ncbi:hypothetical protein M758_12G117300 [Ceratodon purpureus]|nr:hypothetical protein M758_12G117300 [Ceratodon purpureus]